MRTLYEIIHILAGIFGAALMARIASWAVPLARHDIWLVSYAAMIAIFIMGLPLLKKAWLADAEMRHVPDRGDAPLSGHE